ncbi:MAG TPA: hypothetical protein DCL95_02920 [Rhodospirillaceae bacterium]|nr:hypothetical protein [Rhodospirillaceae bacterium]
MPGSEDPGKLNREASRLGDVLPTGQRGSLSCNVKQSEPLKTLLILYLLLYILQYMAMRSNAKQQ